MVYNPKNRWKGMVVAIDLMEGDLLKMFKRGYFDVIFHGCNTKCVMGAGIAKKIKDMYPKAYEADLATRNKKDKLGTMSFVETKHGFICNLYTQDNYVVEEGIINLDYEALEKSIDALLKKFPYNGTLFGCPWIGCGLAGGDKGKVAEILERKFDGRDLTIVEFA